MLTLLLSTLLLSAHIEATPTQIERRATATACAISSSICSFKQDFSHFAHPRRHCNAHGTLDTKKVHTLGPSCKADSLKDCYASCTSTKGCVSFAYNKDKNQCTRYSTTLNRQNFQNGGHSGVLYSNKHCFTSEPCLPSPFNIQAIGGGGATGFLAQSLEGTGTTSATPNVFNDTSADEPLYTDLMRLDHQNGHLITSDGNYMWYGAYNFSQTPTVQVALCTLDCPKSDLPSDIKVAPLVCTVDTSTALISCQLEKIAMMYDFILDRVQNTDGGRAYILLMNNTMVPPTIPPGSSDKLFPVRLKAVAPEATPPPPPPATVLAGKERGNSLLSSLGSALLLPLNHS